MQVRIKLIAPHVDGSERVLYGKVCVGHFSSIPDDRFRATWFLDKHYPTFVADSREEVMEWFESMTRAFIMNFLIIGEQHGSEEESEAERNPASQEYDQQ